MPPPVLEPNAKAVVVAERPNSETIRSLPPMNRIVFTPSGLDANVEAGISVLDAARQLGVDLDSVCGGRGICGRCQITPSVGTFAKWGIHTTVDSLTAPNKLETDYHGNRPLVVGNRLGCSARICGDESLTCRPQVKFTVKLCVRTSI